MTRRFARGAAGWLFGLALSVALIGTWGRAVVSDANALSEAARPLAQTSQVAGVVSNWLREEMVDLGVPEDSADQAASDAMSAPALEDTMSRLMAEVALAAASAGPEAAVVDVASLLRPVVPDLTAALRVAMGSKVPESEVARAVDSLDPLVVAAEGEVRSLGPSSPAASRLGVASVLALATMLVAGWGLVASGDDRTVEFRRLLNRIALGALSFAVMLRLGSWVLSPRAGRAPVSEALSVIAASKWTLPLLIGLLAGAAALIVQEAKRAARRRRSAADAVERPIEGGGGGEEPGMLAVPIGPSLVGDPAENGERVFPEDGAGEIVAEADGQGDAVPGVAEGVPGAVDPTDVR